MKKVLAVLVSFALVFTIALTGCSSSSYSGKGYAMVTDVGGVNDNSFNQSAWEGLQKFNKDKNVPVKYLESKQDADYEVNLNAFVKEGRELTWAIGFLMESAVAKVAQENPNSKIAIIDSAMGGNVPANVAAVVFKEHEGSFLVGVIAGLTTKTNKVGFVGGVDFDLIRKFQYGFEAGVKTVNPNATVISIYTGAFDKPDLGKQAAATMYDQGIDIIYHASGATGDGVFTEAKERKAKGQDIWVIGVDKDQAVTFGNEVTLTSMVKRVDNAIYQVSDLTLNGKFPGGTLTVLGLKEDGVGIAPTQVNIPKDVLTKVDEYKDKIIKGEIKVPATKEEFEQFK